MKRFTIFLICIMILMCFVACNNSAEDNQSEIKQKYTIALICDLNAITDETIENNVYNSMLEFSKEDKTLAKKYHPQSDKRVHIITSIDNAVLDGNNVIAVVGNTYGNAVSSIAAEYPHTKFIIFGMDDAIALHNNVYCCKTDTDYLKFLQDILI